jgi:hypothetical protein
MWKRLHYDIRIQLCRQEDKVDENCYGHIDTQDYTFDASSLMNGLPELMPKPSFQPELNSTTMGANMTTTSEMIHKCPENYFGWGCSQ